MNRIALCTLIVTAFTCSPAQGGLISNVTFDSGTNLFTYDYTIDNSGTTAIIGLGLDLFAPVLGTSFPVGWDVSVMPLGPESLVQWISLDIPFDVPPSGLLNGFSITSSAGPGTVSFSFLDENFDSVVGQTTGPTAVPEPSYVLITLVALSLLTFSKRRRDGKTCQGLRSWFAGSH